MATFHHPTLTSLQVSLTLSDTTHTRRSTPHTEHRNHHPVPVRSLLSCSSPSYSAITPTGASLSSSPAHRFISRRVTSDLSDPSVIAPCLLRCDEDDAAVGRSDSSVGVVWRGDAVCLCCSWLFLSRPPSFSCSFFIFPFFFLVGECSGRVDSVVSLPSPFRHSARTGQWMTSTRLTSRGRRIS